MTLEAQLTEKERKKLCELINDPEAMDEVLEKALKGWRRGKNWKKQTKKS
jgi:exonuclease VII small subunit